MAKDISNYCCLAFDRSEEDKWLYALTEGRNDEGKAEEVILQLWLWP